MILFFFFFKQKTAYDMRISDWSSDVFSSDLKRPQDKVILTAVDDEFNADLKKIYNKDAAQRVAVAGKDHDIGDGDVVIAAITSCTNTSNPGVMVAAGLVAKKANERGMKPKPWVKTSLAPGSQVVTDYLRSEEHTSELQSLMRISYAVFCLKKNKTDINTHYLLQPSNS